MNHFMRGFADELIKIAAYPQHERPAGYDLASAIQSVMDATQGSGARTGLKSGQPQLTATAQYNVAPTPLTTPNHLTNFSSLS